MGLGIKYTRMRQNAQNPHSAPFRTPTTKVDYQDPIKDCKIFPGGEKPTTEYIYIKLYSSSRALVEDNLREMEENYYKHTIGVVPSRVTRHPSPVIQVKMQSHDC